MTRLERCPFFVTAKILTDFTVAETRDPKWEDGQCARNRLTLPNLVVLLPPVIKQAGLTKFKVVADVLEKKKKKASKCG
jgi:hypothetical protein